MKKSSWIWMLLFIPCTYLQGQTLSDHNIFGGSKSDVFPLTCLIDSGKQAVLYQFSEETEANGTKFRARSNSKTFMNYLLMIIDNNGNIVHSWQPDSMYFNQNTVLGNGSTLGLMLHYHPLAKRLYMISELRNGVLYNAGDSLSIPRMSNNRSDGFLLEFDSALLLKRYTRLDNLGLVKNTNNFVFYKDTLFYLGNVLNRLNLYKVSLSSLWKDSSNVFVNRFETVNLVVHNTELMTVLTFRDTLRAGGVLLGGIGNSHSYLAPVYNISVNNIKLLLQQSSAGTIGIRNAKSANGYLVVCGSYGLAEVAVSGGSKMVKPTTSVAYALIFDSSFVARQVDYGPADDADFISSSCLDLELYRDHVYTIVQGLGGGSRFAYRNWLPMGGGLLLCKSDLNGNLLWVSRMSSPGNPTSFWSGTIADNSRSAGNLVFTIAFWDTITIGDKMITKSRKDWDILLAVIRDGSIERGPVDPGPYCAGDSIFIPFVANGNFADTNRFVAELSDAKGSFSSTTILGSYEGSNSGTITCKLSDIGVKSGSRYRIRVRSTSPEVFNYYITDTLNLLVYSRDKAHTGADTTVCYGSVLGLDAIGGTRWQWSPAALIVHPERRETRTVPLTSSFQLRIAISDSSGCGQPDTAFRNITVLPALKLSGRDTMVCRNALATLTATSNYDTGVHYTWLDKHGKSHFGAVFTSVYDTTELLKLIGKQYCSPQADTIEIQVEPLPALFLEPQRDTALCGNSVYQFHPKGIGGNGKYHYRAWYNETLLTGTDWFILGVNNGGVVRVELSDGCTNPVAVRNWNLSPLPLASLPRTRDTALCLGSLFNDSLNETISPYHFIHRWELVDSKGVSTFNGTRISFVLKERGVLRRISEDQCGRLYQHERNLGSIPAPVFITGVNDTSLCEGVVFSQQVEATEGIKPLVSWWRDGVFQGSGNPLDVRFKVEANSSHRFIASSNCTSLADTIDLGVRMRALPNPYFISPMEPFYANYSRLSGQATERRAVSYRWELVSDVVKTNTNGLYFFHDPQLPGIYKLKLIVTDSFSCQDSSERSFEVLELQRCYIPNAFTPDGNVHNPAFGPVGIGIRSFIIRVYGRNGGIEFSGEENQYWTGEGAMIGTYPYEIKVLFNDGRKEVFKGMVHLMR
jgi:hypothetical protein